MIDGDDTYDAAAAPLMIKTLLDGPYDHVLGVRRQDEPARRPTGRATRPATRCSTAWSARCSARTSNDMLSGYRVFSRRFVKSFPAVSREFEIETELTVHSLHLRVPQTAVPVGFRDRPAGSESKLRTYRDGFQILGLIIGLARHERPVAFYGLFGIAELARLGRPDRPDRLRVLRHPRGTALPDAVPRASPCCCVGAWLDRRV